MCVDMCLKYSDERMYNVNVDMCVFRVSEETGLVMIRGG